MVRNENISSRTKREARFIFGLLFLNQVGISRFNELTISSCMKRIITREFFFSRAIAKMGTLSHQAVSSVASNTCHFLFAEIQF